MNSKFKGTVYRMLSPEQVTLNEIAEKLMISLKMILRALLRFTLIKEDVYYKKSGRIHLFWRELRLGVCSLF